MIYLIIKIEQLLYIYIYTHIYTYTSHFSKFSHTITSFADLNHISYSQNCWALTSSEKLLYGEAHLEETKESSSQSVTNINFFFNASLSGSGWQRTIMFAILNICTMFSKNLNSGLKTAASETPAFFLRCFTSVWAYY